MPEQPGPTTAPSSSRNCLPHRLTLQNPPDTTSASFSPRAGQALTQSFQAPRGRLSERPAGSGTGARTPPSSRRGRGGRPGARTHPTRGARAGRCVGRGRARVTCTPRSRRLPIGLSSRYQDRGWCGEVGSRVAQVAQRTVVSIWPEGLPPVPIEKAPVSKMPCSPSSPWSTQERVPQASDFSFSLSGPPLGP